MGLNAEELNVGDSYSEVIVEDLTRTQIVQYAGASGDYNPVHSDEKFVTEVAGYPTVFAHGMLTMGMTGKMITNYVGDGRLTYYGVRFVNQVWPGDTLTARAEVAEVREENGETLVDLAISTTNQDEKFVLTGNATARLNCRPTEYHLHLDGKSLSLSQFLVSDGNYHSHISRVHFVRIPREYHPHCGEFAKPNH